MVQTRKSVTAALLWAVAGVFLSSAGVHATIITTSNISSLDTGAAGTGPGDTLANAPILDPNWTVSLLSGGPPPNGSPTVGSGSHPTYLVPNSIPGNVGPNGVPEWLPNGPTSSWITYSSPTENVIDNTNEVFQYELVFTAGGSGVIGINFLSDNIGMLYVNGGATPLASNSTNLELGMSGLPNTDGLWLASPVALPLISGSTYTIDIRVSNMPDGNLANPSGVRVEFTNLPDSGSTLMMLGAAFVAVAGVRRRLMA